MKTGIVGIASFFLLTGGPLPVAAWECLKMEGAWFAPGCDPTVCQFVAGNSLTWHFVAGEFTAQERDLIEQGAEAWNAGAGEINRGADWRFVRGADQQLPNASDTRVDVLYQPSTWFPAHGAPSDSLALTLLLYHPFNNLGTGCKRKGADVVFNRGVTYSAELPNRDGGNPSMAIVAAHEFGHVLGFAHENDVISLMQAYPDGGDMSNQLRLNETDYVGLVAKKPGPSSGNNLMLSKFRFKDNAYGEGHAEEVWTASPAPSDAAYWRACRGEKYAGDTLIEPILAISNSTADLLNGAVTIQWTLRPDGASCFGPSSIEIGRRSMGLIANTPASVNFTSWRVPFGLATGNYTVCAKIDPDDEIAETSEREQVLISERQLLVYSEVTVFDPPCPPSLPLGRR